AVDRSLKFADFVFLSCLNKAFWLLHVDIFFEVSVQIGGLDVHLMHFEVFLRCQGEENSNRVEFRHWSEGLLKIDSCLLSIAFSHKSSLVPFDVTSCIALDLEDPAAPYCFPTGREVNESPGFVLDDRIVFLLRGLLPLF